MSADRVPPLRSPELASRADSRLVLIDLQEKLMPHIHDGAAVVECCRKLATAARLLGVPITATEQYPKGLGPTVAPLKEFVGIPPEKLRFSATEALGWPESSNDDSRHRVIIAGVEAHVCVQQTALDLIALGYRCYVPVDAVGSRKSIDRDWALQRLQTSGAVLTTTEALLFEWCESAEAVEFKTLSRLVTGR